MERKDFLKTCAAGICSCGVIGMLTQVAVAADSTGSNDSTNPPAATAPSETDQLKYALDGAQERFANLLSVMDNQLDDSTRDNLLLGLGNLCAQKYTPLFEKFKGNLDGYLTTIKTAWVEQTEYNEKTGILRVIGKPGPCGCPLVKAGRTPAQFCTCAAGWSRAAFSTVLGKPVTVEVEESVLGGGTRCSFRVKTA
jgi:hypothetical protein